MICQKRYKNISTIEQAISTQSPSLTDIYKANGERKTELYLGLWLTDFSDVVVLKNPLNMTQINFIIDEILTDYRNLRLADINLIFKQAKSGVYGKFYERVSPSDVVTWFRNYNELRMETCAGKSYNSSQNHKESGAEERNSEMTVKQFLQDKKDKL